MSVLKSFVLGKPYIVRPLNRPKEMDSMLKFFVPGKPIAQPRQRHRVIAGKGRKPFAQNYTPAKHPVQEWKAAVVEAAEAEMKKAGIDLFEKDVPLIVSMVFLMPRPASHYRANGELKKSFCVWMTKKPDVDNLTKGLQDAMSGVVYHDDNQIVDLRVRKQYCNQVNQGVMVEVQRAVWT